MARNKYNSVFKQKIIDDHKSGTTQSQLCTKYNMSKAVISRLITKYKATGTVDTEHKGGRPRKTTEQTDRKIVRHVKKNPFASARETIRELQLDISENTVRRRLDHAGLHSYRAAKKPFISAKNRKARLEFAKTHKNWTIDQWKRVLWSDESKFNLRGSDGKKTVRRPTGKRLDPRFTVGTVKHGGGKGLMVWGCFSGFSGLGPLHRIDKIMDQFIYKSIMEDQMLPFAEDNMPLRWTFQQDNDPKHTSKLVKNWFTTKQINVMKWPAQSPDLNPIENLWKQVDDLVRLRGTFKNADELHQEIQVAWSQISQAKIDKLIESMPRRCQEVIKNNGYAINY